MEQRDLLLIICSVGAIQSFFWGTYLLLFHYQARQNRLLGFLMMALAIRIGKSTLYLFSAELDIVLMNIGFAAHWLIGPLLWHYTKSLKGEGKWAKLQWLHYLPGLITVIASPWLELDDFWYRGAYSILLIHSLIYWVLALFNTRNIHDKVNSKLLWLRLLNAAIGVLIIAYFSNYILRLNSYLTGPLLYSLVIYALGFYLLKNFGTLFSHRKKYSNLNLTNDALINFKQRIEMYFMEHRPYIANDYKLSQLSKDLSIPKHVLSALFSETLNTSFTDFINMHRIEEAKRRLKSDHHLTISSIAFDCGFNTLSSFNHAFKKFTNTTPSKFRSEAVNQGL